MSNAWIKSSTSSGPSTPTSFKVDSTNTVNPPIAGGTSTPIANLEQFYGNYGIQVTVNTTNNNAIQFGFSANATTTTPSQTVAILSFPISTDSVFSFNFLIAARGTTTGNGVGGNTLVIVKNKAGTLSLVNMPNYFLDGDVGLTDASYSITFVGNIITINVIGSASESMDWNCCTPGSIFVS